ncbi:MAG: 4-coumarate--CoA ligase [Betaproteobacteria bacterium RIFCSPLOWO2_02_FULL_63_19]|nr:MAG: 4-coumarate--CoA ligase [Betaproteobacteria bacterium RIFCSPLOWO2_02_FULL_63_19]
MTNSFFDQPFCAIPDLVRSQAERRPDHAALKHEQRVVDYAALDALIDRVAASLQRDAIRVRDTVAICAATSIEYAAVFLGASRAGVAVAHLPPFGTSQSLEGMLADAGAKLLFADAAALASFAPVRDRMSAHCIALDAQADVRTQRLDDWLAAEGARPNAVPIVPEWAFNIIYSSGTTGVPKGIVQSHAMRWGYLQRTAPYGYGPESVTLVATPLYSNTTLVTFLPTLGLGGTVVLMGKFDAARYLALAEKHRVTHTILVPVQYQRIMASPEFDRYDLSSFRFKLCTSAPFAAGLKADVLKRWPGGLVELYGLTEGGGTCILAAHEHPDKLHTVGRPAPGHEVRLIDEHGREVPAGEVGEVVGRSPVMMTGYHNQPAMTAETEWFDAEGKRYLRTGDIGRFDPDGFLMLLDRRKDMIISGGFNIYPSDLEAVVREHPGVAEVAVVGVPSARWGETPLAFVVVRSGACVGAEELFAWANARLGNIQRLAAVELIDSLPRNAIGKVMKRELRDTLSKSLVSLDTTKHR